MFAFFRELCLSQILLCLLCPSHSNSSGWGKSRISINIVYTRKTTMSNMKELMQNKGGVGGRPCGHLLLFRLPVRDGRDAGVCGLIRSRPKAMSITIPGKLGLLLPGLDFQPKTPAFQNERVIPIAPLYLHPPIPISAWLNTCRIGFDPPRRLLATNHGSAQEPLSELSPQKKLALTSSSPPVRHLDLWRTNQNSRRENWSRRKIITPKPFSFYPK